jgi:Mn2+/Fe2+ NRAMP family transporter
MYRMVHARRYKEEFMKSANTWLFLLFGFAFWVVGTVWYELRGPSVFETSPQRYWINFVLTAVFSAAFCIVIMKWRQISAASWSSAALLIALPGMFGEAILLSNFGRFMPRMRVESGGKYGAFLFAAYALFLTISEIVTVRATGK